MEGDGQARREFVRDDEDLPHARRSRRNAQAQVAELSREHLGAPNGLARVVAVEAERALEGRKVVANQGRVASSFLLVLVVAFVLSCLLCAVDDESSSDHRWECLAIALDHVVGMPMSWGVASALRHAPELANALQRPGGAPTVHVTKWATRAVADAHFVPVDACGAIWAGGEGASAEDATVRCSLAGLPSASSSSAPPC